MRHHAGRGRILDLGIADHTHREIELALGELGDGLDLRMLEITLVARRVDTERIDARLVPGGIGAHRIGRVGGERIHPRRADQCHLRHVVDRQLAEIFSLLDPLRQDARGRAVGHAHPVADEENDVLGYPRAGREHRPGDLAAARAVARHDRVDAGLVDAGVPQYQGRGVQPVLVLDKLPGLAELPSVILAVDRNLEVGLLLDLRELDLEVEAGAGEDRSSVDRIDRLGGKRGPNQGKTRDHNEHARCCIGHRSTLGLGRCRR